MALILKGGGVFLHIPKTGGNWVTAVLRECGLAQGGLGHKHADLDHLLIPMNYHRSLVRAHVQVQKIKRRLDPKPFLFCFVRHPLKWYESWFKYQTQPARNWRNWGRTDDLFDWHPNAALNGCGADTFDQFIRNAIERRPGYVSEMFSQYARPQVDFVGKQESLREGLVTALKRLNLNFDEDFIMNFKEVGVSPQPKQRVEWDPELRKKMLRLEHIALLRHGYLDDGELG